MGRLIRAMTAATLVFTGVHTAGAQQASLSGEETARIKAEVKEAVHTYYRLFTERNMKALGERVYNVPWISIGAGGVQVDATADAVTARFEASLKQLLAGGWDRSEFPNPSVCVLNAGAAIASGTFTRYKKDGSVMQQNGVTYLFARTKDGWKIVSFTGHPVDKVVTCND